MALSQVWKGVGPLSHPMPTWICVNSIIPCPGVIDKEGADNVGVHSSQTITFRMMITSTHFFHGIKERAHVFIPLKAQTLQRHSIPLEDIFLLPRCGVGVGPSDQ